jgi:hypothetical protein
VSHAFACGYEQQARGRLKGIGVDSGRNWVRPHDLSVVGAVPFDGASESRISNSWRVQVSPHPLFLRCKRVTCIVKVSFWWWPDELIASEHVTAGRGKLIFPCKVLLAVDQEKLSAMGSLHEIKCSLSPATPPLAAAISSGGTFHLTAYFLFAVGHCCAKSGRLRRRAFAVSKL